MRNTITIIIAFIFVTVALSTNQPPTHQTPKAEAKTVVVAPAAPKSIEPPIAPVEAPKAPVAVPVTPQVQQAVIAPKPVALPVDEATAKAFIYSHESGNNPQAVNRSSGACGLGQSLPCSKLLAVCPGMDYACQDSWFSNYALNRYGSWAAAMAYWQQNRWW